MPQDQSNSTEGSADVCVLFDMDSHQKRLNEVCFDSKD